MSNSCPTCGGVNRENARYCAQCGLPLSPGVGVDRVQLAGRVAHPQSVRPPANMRAVHTASDLYYCWGSAWGGQPLIGTEPLQITLFNGGYALLRVVLQIQGVHADGSEAFRVIHEIDAIPRGREVRVEVPSYDVTAPAKELRVSLRSAEFDPGE